MKRIWYYLVRAYVMLGLRFYYRKIIIRNASNIPDNEAVIFAANHQNAFLDAIVIACTNKLYGHFLVRADIFKKGWAIRLLNSLNMMPVFRIRDGWQSLGKNQKTFDRCETILARKNAVVIFPEGNHGSQRRLRNLSKGFTRVAFESVKKNPDRKIYIVPVGLNYTNAQAYRSSMSVFYGEPLLANQYFSGDDPAGATRLKDDLAARMKTLITHIDDESTYPSIAESLEATAPDYLDPIDTNRRIALIVNGTSPITAPQHKSSHYKYLFPLRWLSEIVNFLPLTLWAAVRKKIKDPVFIGSIKFAMGIFIFPLYYIIVSLGVYFVSGAIIAALVFMLLVPSMFIRNSSF